MDLARASRVDSAPEADLHATRGSVFARNGRQYGIFYPHEKACLIKAYFHFPSRESGSGFEL